MPKEYDITGLGPINKDGSRKIFTRLPQPFIVSKEWLAENPNTDVGDIIHVADDGALHLLGVPKVKEEQPEAQKKSHGSAELGTSSLAEFSSYKGKPIIVHASEITAVGEIGNEGERNIILKGGGERIATAEMLSRMTPEIGDYWVMVPQDNGMYEYLNPKAVFENKYELIEPEHTV